METIQTINAKLVLEKAMFEVHGVTITCINTIRIYTGVNVHLLRMLESVQTHLYKLSWEL